MRWNGGFSPYLSKLLLVLSTSNLLRICIELKQIYVGLAEIESNLSKIFSMSRLPAWHSRSSERKGLKDHQLAGKGANAVFQQPNHVKSALLKG